MALKSSQSASDILYDLFLLPRWILTHFYASTAETHIFVHTTLAKMVAHRSAMFSDLFFSPLIQSVNDSTLEGGTYAQNEWIGSTGHLRRGVLNSSEKGGT